MSDATDDVRQRCRASRRPRRGLVGWREHVVLAPGQPVGPARLRAYDAAQDRLTLHTRIDERSAAFLALGLAKTSRRPVAVVTTSGTATANLHPAVLEAHHAGVRAGRAHRRPAGRAARHQRQPDHRPGRDLYGAAVRPPPTCAPGGRRGGPVRVPSGAGCRSRGPCHLNLQFDEPLVARPGPLASRRWSRRAASGTPAAPTRPCSRRGTTGAPSWSPATTRARALGSWPSSTAGRCFAEPTSGSRTGDQRHPHLPAAARRRGAAGHGSSGSSSAGTPRSAGRSRRLISRTDVEVVGGPRAARRSPTRATSYGASSSSGRPSDAPPGRVRAGSTSGGRPTPR